METHDYEKWKSSVLASNKQDKKEGIETVLAFFLIHIRAKDWKTVNLVFALSLCSALQETNTDKPQLCQGSSWDPEVGGVVRWYCFYLDGRWVQWKFGTV